MFDHNISRHVFIDRAMNTVAAGNGDTQCGDIIDTLGYESIIFAVGFGAIVNTAVTTLKLQYGNWANGGDMGDITNGSVSVTDVGDNQTWLSVELHRPTKRYVRACVVRATANATINWGIVLMARGGLQPPTQGTNAGNVTPAILVSP